MIWTARNATIKTGETMMNANHAMTSATVSSVSPWRNEAWARDGSARNVKATNRTKPLPQDRHDFAYERMSESFGFMVYQLPISALYIFNDVFVEKCERRVCNCLARRFAAQW